MKNAFLIDALAVVVITFVVVAFVYEAVERDIAALAIFVLAFVWGLIFMGWEP